MSSVRAKFRCTGIQISPSNIKEEPLVYSTQFEPVFGTYGESEENKEFWKWTPSGKLDLQTIRKMPFEVGKQYYLDITEAE